MPGLFLPSTSVFVCRILKFLDKHLKKENTPVDGAKESIESESVKKLESI